MRRGEGLLQKPKDLLNEMIQARPELATALFRWITENRIDDQVPFKYVEEIALAILHDDPVFLLGPHFSAFDVAGFTRLVSKLNQYYEDQHIGTEECGIFWPKNVQVVGPLSSKFVQTGNLRTRMGFEGSFVMALKWLNLTLYPVIQVQDQLGSQALGKEEAQSRNTKAWKSIAKAMQEPTVLFGMFPEGTRAEGPGAARPPVELCAYILGMLEKYQKGMTRKDQDGKRRVKVKPLVAPFVLLGSHRTWGTKHKDIAHKPELVLAKPMTLAQMSKLVSIVQFYLSERATNSVFADRELHPVEAVHLFSLYNAPEEFWGVYAQPIQIMKQLVSSNGGSIDEFICSFGSS